VRSQLPRYRVADVRTLAHGEGGADRVATVLLPGAVRIEIRVPAGETTALQPISKARVHGWTEAASKRTDAREYRAMNLSPVPRVGEVAAFQG
jgi:hypothetical protein